MKPAKEPYEARKGEKAVVAYRQRINQTDMEKHNRSTDRDSKETVKTRQRAKSFTAAERGSGRG
uniref:Expressed protein n=1 Tax=Schizophyllum commune (strain H4-8 / FGSC 9210) TaxID=578458 RepID=D8QJ38_SCHCM